MPTARKVALALSSMGIRISAEVLHNLAGTVGICRSCHDKYHFAEFAQSVHPPRVRKLDGTASVRRYFGDSDEDPVVFGFCRPCRIDCAKITLKDGSFLHRCPSCNRLYKFRD